MIAIKMLQQIDKNFDSFKHWGCSFNCLEEPWKCQNTNPVTRYICYKLYS